VYRVITDAISNKKHLKNVGPIHHCEPSHAHSPDVASGTVARRLCIDVHDNDDNDDNDNDDRDRYGPMEWAQLRELLRCTKKQLVTMCSGQLRPKHVSIQCSFEMSIIHVLPQI